MRRTAAHSVRQYLFRRRHDRRRVAQALAAGVPVASVAAIERAEPQEIERLLGERSFKALVEHYRSDGEDGREARLERIAAVALDLLELAIESGDVRAAIFFLAERRCGRDPGRTVAGAVLRSVERAEAAARAKAERPAGGHDSAIGTGAAAHRQSRSTPSNPVGAAGAGDRFAFCSATHPTPAAAEAMAVGELQGFQRRIAAITRGLRDRVRTEMERIGTAWSDRRGEDAIRAFARNAHGQPEAGLTAALSLEARREAAAALARARPAEYDRLMRTRAPPAGGGVSRSDDPWESRAAPSGPPLPACRDSP